MMSYPNGYFKLGDILKYFGPCFNKVIKYCHP